MSSSRRLILHWFRRDLRLTDNTALHHAAQDGDQVATVYVLSDWKKDHLWTGPKRQHFLCDALEALASDIEEVGIKLIFRSGAAVEQLEKIIEELKADALYFNRDLDPFGKAIEREVGEMGQRLGIEVRAFHDGTLHAPNEVLTKSGKPYRVFTPYSRNWLSLEKPELLPEVKKLSSGGKVNHGKPPTLAHWDLKPDNATILPAGEKAAKARLQKFVSEGLSTYKEDRDQPAIEGTSRLSQDLRFGLLSPRTVYHEVQQAMKHLSAAKARESAETYVKELAWREFYAAVLDEFPEILQHEFNPDWRGLPWSEPGKEFEAWKAGETGFPIVDAGLRQLVQTGFMHNRVRMIVAMFLTKDLHIDWRLGEQFFMQHLVDGEIGSNNGGWQWSAGVGADAAPYFRIQNPWSQTKRYDPKGEYIKRWIPELKNVPVKRLMEPPANGKPLVDGYPLPCVDHATERARTLAIFKRHRAKKG